MSDRPENPLAYTTWLAEERMVPDVTRLLASDPTPLYALIDPARDAELLPALQAAAVPLRCLYEDDAARDLAPAAPHVAQLATDAPILKRLLEDFWGQSVLTFLNGRADLDALRAHFRRFTQIRLDDGRVGLFRFYDPRVLKLFLPSLDPARLAEFFGPIDRFVIDGGRRDAAVLFRAGADGRLDLENMNFRSAAPPAGAARPPSVTAGGR